ncbi:hypothetical protein ABK040_007614 [Willaertia magna]
MIGINNTSGDTTTTTQKRRLNTLQNHFLSTPVNHLLQAFQNQTNINNNQHSQFTTATLSSSKNTNNNNKQLNDYIIKAKIHPDVLNALTQNNKSIVALESTIISHGMPYPKNIETAKRVEEEIRKQGAIPATICIIDGIIHIGINDEELDKFGKLGMEKKVMKCSRRDIALVCSQNGNGATTVSATMLLAHRFGIHVFVTGGIGGVHRVLNTNEIDPMDISSDLTELGRTPVCVVSAGVKSILDIPRTLEYLETQGVTVASYQTDEFPAFFTSKSGSKAHCRLDSPMDCAKLISSNLQLGLNSGMLIAVPIPEKLEAKAAPLTKAIEQALEEAKMKDIKGKEVTPFLLQRINELTGGDSLRANIELILNNARVGGQIAVQLNYIQQLQQNQIKLSNELFQNKSLLTSIYDTTTNHYNNDNYNDNNYYNNDDNNNDSSLFTKIGNYLFHKTHSNNNSSNHLQNNNLQNNNNQIIIIGGSVIDISCSPEKSKKLILKTSNPGTITQSYGGVARNVCHVLSKLFQSSLSTTNYSNKKDYNEKEDYNKIPIHFISAVGLDSFGISLKKHLENDLKIISKNVIEIKNNRTAIYNCLLDENGDLIAAISDMYILMNDLFTKHVQIKLLDIYNSILNNTLQNSLQENLQLNKLKRVLIFLDSNTSVEALETINQLYTIHNNKNNKNNTKNGSHLDLEIFVDPTSVIKSKQVVLAKILDKITFIKPNEHEIYSIVECFTGKKFNHLNINLNNHLNNNNNEMVTIDDCFEILLKQAKVKHVLLTQGPKGLIHATLNNQNKMIKRQYDALPIRKDKCEIYHNVNGCGDNFSGGFLFGRFHNYSIHESIQFGLRASRLALESSKSVNDYLSFSLLLND